jgi:hypothetical protein
MPVDADGLVTLTHVPTGAVLRRWPVDARELLAVGEHRLGTPEPAGETLTPAGEAVLAELAVLGQAQQPDAYAELSAATEQRIPRRARGKA